jgi:hypothetical protein
MRAVFEPLIVSHFGEAIVEEVFSRYHYKKTALERLPKTDAKYQKADATTI